MAVIVVKFGGTSLADPDKIKRVAGLIAEEVRRGHQVAAVVSAMAGVTNQMAALCHQINPECDLREYDTVVATGEQVTTGLLSIALQSLGVPARSWQGWQVPIITDEVHGRARISHIETEKLKQRLSEGIVTVISGFQGLSEEGRITTLGRGGSDTSAVAIATALGADRCDIYTDVDGVYTADPRIVPKARKIKQVAYEEMLEMAWAGAKVLHPRSVEMAVKNKVRLQVLSSFQNRVGSDLPGTMVVDEGELMEKEVVTGITCSLADAKITLVQVPDIPGVAAKIFSPLADANVNVDMIVQNVSKETGHTDVTFTVPKEDMEKSVRAIRASDPIFEGLTILADENVAKISVIGIGMQSHAGVAQTMFITLADKGINISVISTSEIKISVLIERDYAELAMRVLHDAYRLEGKG